MTAPTRETAAAALAEPVAPAAAAASSALVLQTARTVLGQAEITEKVSISTTLAIRLLWRQVDPYNPAQVAQFAVQAGRLMVGSQKTVANAASASQLAQLRSLGINLNFPVTIPDNVRGSTVEFGAKTPKVKQPRKVEVDYADGEQAIPRSDPEPDKLFERAAETYRYEKSIGKPDEEANAAAEERIAKLVDGNIMLAQRLGEQQTLTRAQAENKRVLGYRRVIHPELSKGGVCGLCVAASDRKYRVSELKPIHYRCKCGVSPITADEDPGFALNQDGLDRLYADAGESTAGKDLKKLRYELVDHDELGPMLVRTKGEKVPYYNTSTPAPEPKKVETPADVARRLLPGMEASLANLRKQGLAEDSPQITYHLTQIARFQAALT